MGGFELLGVSLLHAAAVITLEASIKIIREVPVIFCSDQ
jgi:hypothetical protein